MKLKTKSIMFILIFFTFIMVGWWLANHLIISKGNEKQLLIAENILKKQKKDVIVFGTEWCPYCKKTKDYLDSYNVQYHWLDIENSRENKKLFESFKVDGVPLIITRNFIIEGYREDALEQIHE